jgi:hypothetical protein
LAQFGADLATGGCAEIRMLVLSALATLPANPGEQQQAAKLLGVSEVNFSGLGEQSLRDGCHELHENLVRMIRQVAPQRIVRTRCRCDIRAGR